MIIDGSKRTQHIMTMSDAVNQLMDLGETVFVRKGSFFMQADRFYDYIYIVKEGLTVSVETYYNGKTRNGLIMPKGTPIGETFVLMQEVCPVNFKAISDCQLVRIYRDDLVAYMEQNPELYKVLIESLSKKLMSTMDELRQMAGCNVTWRICNLLLVFAEHYGVVSDGKICIDAPVSQQHFAWMLYLNRITVVRVFKRLQDLKLLEKNSKRYYITDLKAFKEYMDKFKYGND